MMFLAPLPMVYIFSQLIRFAGVCFNVDVFNNRNLFLSAKLLKQGYRDHKIRKAFSNSTTDFRVNCYILKAIKNATGTSVIFHINNSLIHFVFVLTSVPNVGERFTKT